MDSPFAQDNRGFPFQKPFEPQAPARPAAFDSLSSPIGGPLRPFTDTKPRLADDMMMTPQPTPWTPARALEPLAPALDPMLPSRILPATPPEPAAASAILPRFFLTTTSSVEGHPIQAFLDILSVEVVVPKDILFRNPAPYGELHRLKAAEDMLQQVKAKAMEELAEKAKQAGADGVVGVRLAFVNLDTVCCLCSVVGTAVRL